MNRELKFRAWDTVGKKMIYDANSDIKIYLNGSISQRGSWVDPEVIALQWTGLKDKNGKMIYDGDIVKQGENHISPVIWEHDSWGFHFGEDDIPGETCEIIGNIYENPELLK